MKASVPACRGLRPMEGKRQPNDRELRGIKHVGPGKWGGVARPFQT